jgi:hypothetical protein
MSVSFIALHVSVTILTILRDSAFLAQLSARRMFSTHPGEQWRGANGNVNREQATGQGKVVQKYNIRRAGSCARNAEPLRMVDIVTETCRAIRTRTF